MQFCTHFKCLIWRLALATLWFAATSSIGLGQNQDLPNPFELLPGDSTTPAAESATDVASPATNPFPADRGTEASPREPAPETPDDAEAFSNEAQAEPSSVGDASAIPPENTDPADDAEVAPAAVEVPRPRGADKAAEELEPVDEFAPAAALAAAPDPAQDLVLQKTYRKAFLIDASGPIFERFFWYLDQRLDLAQQQGADLVIIRLTSPGGDLERSLQLSRRLRDMDWATCVVFIPQEAISGGAILALGADRIYMQEGALIGDAGPITLGAGGQFEHVPEKIVSYSAGAIREIALATGRPAALAEAMVDRNLTVYQATEIATGEIVYVTQRQLDDPQFAAGLQVGQPVPEAGNNRFLTLGARRAAELSLSDGVFASETELLEQFSIERVIPTRMNWVDRTVFTLNRPWLTALLVIAGLIGLYLELAAPGISVAGLTSLVCFSIFFWSHVLGGTAGWLEILLFLLGVTCLTLELFVLPGFGVFGISGLALLVISLVMASQDFIVPSNASEWGQFRTNLLFVLGSVLGILVLFFAQILLLDSLPGLNRFRLNADSTKTQDAGSSLTSLTQSSSQNPYTTTVSAGQHGIAESDLRPSGKVRIDDRLMDVITEGDYVEAGTPVEVLRVEGNRIIVRKL